MCRMIQTEFTVVVIGSEHFHLDKFADDLYERYGVRALITSNLPFAKQMVKGVENAVDRLIFIHLTSPTEDLAKYIAEEYEIPVSDAFAIADDHNYMEMLIDFDNSAPDDLIIITFTGRNGTLDDFLDFCGEAFKSIEESQSKKKGDAYDGEKRS